MFQNSSIIINGVIGGIGGMIGFGLANIKQSMYPYKPTTYQDGINDGYAQAKKELQDNAKKNVKSTLFYIEQDANNIKNNITVSDLFLEEKINIALLPRWELNLLGDNYIVRQPLHHDWKKAWLMTKEDSNTLDQQIYNILQDTKFAIDENKVEISKKQIKEEIQCSLYKHSNRCKKHKERRIIHNLNNLNTTK
jgi:hypothetical protein